MNKQQWLLIALLALAGCNAGSEPSADQHGDDHAEEAPTGPNGGRLLEIGRASCRERV